MKLVPSQARVRAREMSGSPVPLCFILFAEIYEITDRFGVFEPRSRKSPLSGVARGARLAIHADLGRVGLRSAIGSRRAWSTTRVVIEAGASLRARSGRPQMASARNDFQN